MPRDRHRSASARPPRARRAPASKAPAKPDRRYAGATADERRAVRRVQLVEAGLDLFSSRGYAETSIAAICGAAGLSERYFYESFRSREQLLEAIFERGSRSMYEAVVAAVALADPPTTESRIRAAISAYLDVLSRDPRSARLLLLEGGLPESFVAGRRETTHAIARFLVRVAPEPEPGSRAEGLDPFVLVLGMVGAADRVVTDWLSGAVKLDREGLLTHLEALFAAATWLSERRGSGS